MSIYADLSTYLKASSEVQEATADAFADGRMERAINLVSVALGANRCLLVCGNGGSAADAMHIVGELVGRFLKERRALKAICLSSNAATITAWSNDYTFDDIFARQVDAYGEPGGVLLAISTSGNSRNVVNAAERARLCEMSVIAMTGEGGGLLAEKSDVLLDVPSRVTPLIQQVHTCLYHYLCAQVEARIDAAGSHPSAE